MKTFNIKKHLLVLKAQILDNPFLFGIYTLLFIMGFWLVGALSDALVGNSVAMVSLDAITLFAMGFHQAVLIATVLVFGTFAACYAYTLGGMPAYVAKLFVKLIITLCLIATLTLALYQHFHRFESISLYPWDWYHVVLLHSPKVLEPKTLTLISLGVAVVFLFAVLMVIGGNRTSKLSHTHFADIFEVQKAGLFAKEGIVLANAYDTKLRAPGYEGALVVAPMGTGKTTAIVIPNLLEWQGSVVVNDLKGELWAKTAKFRKHTLRQQIYCFAPGDETGSLWCYNPFAYVSEDKTLWYRDLQLIAGALIPEDKGQPSFWVQSSRDLFLLLGLYLFETSGMATLQEIYELAKQEDFVGWLAKMIEKGRQKFPASLIHNAASLLKADARTRSNILQDFFARISLFGDPIIQRNTRQNDFDLRMLRKKPMSVYIHIPEREMERLSPLLTLFWVQLIDCLTVKEPNIKEEPYPVLALMDEFGNLSKVDKFRKGLSFLRSYRIVFVIILQYLGQITSVYGRDDTAGFLNTKVKMLFTLTDSQDAKYFSDYMGQTTVKTKARSISSGERGRVSINENEHIRPLLRPEEILRLPENDALILMQGTYPIKARKCYWFKDRCYQKALKPYQEKEAKK